MEIDVDQFFIDEDGTIILADDCGNITYCDTKRFKIKLQESDDDKGGEMRNIAEIMNDDKNGKQLSQTERRIAVAYIQGKYDALRELKIVNNSNTNEVLDKIRAEIEQVEINGCVRDVECFRAGLNTASKIIDKYKAERENKK